MDDQIGEGAGLLVGWIDQVHLDTDLASDFDDGRRYSHCFNGGGGGWSVTHHVEGSEVALLDEGAQPVAHHTPALCAAAVPPTPRYLDCDLGMVL